MAAVAGRFALRSFARYFPQAMRYMARNPGQGGRLLRSSAKYARAAAPVAGLAANAVRYVSKKSKQYLYLKNLKKKIVSSRGKKNQPSVFKKRRITTQGVSGKRLELSRKYVDPFSFYNRKGVVKNIEVYGTEQTDTCCYVEAAVTEPRAWILNMLKALVRKLLQKAGLQIYSCNEAISMKTLGVGGVDFEMVLYTQNQANVSAPSITVSFADGTTVTSLAEAIAQPFYSYSSGSTNAGVGSVLSLVEPNYLVLQRKSSVVNFTYQIANIQLDNLLVEGKMRCIMKIQNQTKSTTGGTDSEDVTNQPLVGKLYYFNGLPRTKVPNQDPGSLENNIFRRFPADRHLKILKDANLEQELREPISPISFWNCIGCTNFKLQPGEIRTFTFWDQVKSQPFLKYLKKFRLEYGTNAPAQLQDQYNLNYCPLKFAMVGLEEQIQSSSSNNLTIGYEIESRCASMFKELRPNFCRTETETKQFPVIV